MSTMKKYNWVGNRIEESDMTKLYHISKECKKPITCLVRDAVKEYLAKR